MDRTRFLIVGGGIAGLATAYFLARRGVRDVVLVEREPTLGTQSSGLNAAILRTLIPQPLIRGLALESAAFMRDPPAGFARAPLVEACGMLLVSDGTAGTVESWREIAGDDIAVEDVAPERVTEIAPYYERETRGGLFVTSDGRLDIAELMSGFERGARAGGHSIRTGVTVEDLIVEEGTVRGARLEGGDELRADVTVLAAGGWAGRLGAAAGSRVQLRPTRRHLLVTAPDDEVDPSWPVVWAQGDEFYARPESGGMLLCACDLEDVDPDDCREDPEVRVRIAEKASRHLPSFAGASAASFWCGMRTLTADEHFVIGADADAPGLFWVAGLGGHGMVCSAGFGRLAADLLVDGTSSDPAAAALSPARFGTSVPS